LQENVIEMMRAKFLPVVALALGILFLAPAAQACCTVIYCPFQISSSTECDLPRTPVCNVWGCNCNIQCGENTLTTGDSCLFQPECTADDAARAQAQARFDEVDASHNGTISSDEATAWAEKQPDFLKKVNRSALPEALQGDDVAISEVVAYAFPLADRDGDGNIAPGEFDVSLQREAKSKD